MQSLYDASRRPLSKLEENKSYIAAQALADMIRDTAPNAVSWPLDAALAEYRRSVTAGEAADNLDRIRRVFMDTLTRVRL